MHTSFLIKFLQGLYGFDVRGPSSFPILQKHYWSNILAILRDKVGADVIVTAVPGCVNCISPHLFFWD
jgi:triacylglycerol lipase